ncbi:MAG: hypothetical protein U5L05_18585 [Rubrivivax sp.]|nr:hypothetical protein [Rubrivivax sp.]
MKTSFLAAALLLPLAVLAQPAPLLTATDPEGDDVGRSLIGTMLAAGDHLFRRGKDL